MASVLARLFHRARRSDFILDEIDASSLQFLRSHGPSYGTARPWLVTSDGNANGVSECPLTDGHDARRAQRSGDDLEFGAVHNDRGPAAVRPPARATESVAPRAIEGQGEEAGPKGGGDEGTRTPDPLLAKEVLSQLSYIPTPSASWAW